MLFRIQQDRRPPVSRQVPAPPAEAELPSRCGPGQVRRPQARRVLSPHQDHAGHTAGDVVPSLLLAVFRVLPRVVVCADSQSQRGEPSSAGRQVSAGPGVRASREAPQQCSACCSVWRSVLSWI